MSSLPKRAYETAVITSTHGGALIQPQLNKIKHLPRPFGEGGKD